MIEVYHNKDFMKYGMNMEEVTEVPKSLLTKVADVDVDYLQEAYQLTNTLEILWTENEGVTPLVDKARSTSIGDVLVIEGQAHIVNDFGFKEITINTKT